MMIQRVMTQPVKKLYAKAKVNFGQKFANPEMDKLAILQDELVQQIPSQYEYNGYGIGLINYPKDNRLGITIFFETKTQKAALVKYLLDQQIIKQEANGDYKYKDALVSFEAVGKFILYGQDSCIGRFLGNLKHRFLG